MHHLHLALSVLIAANIGGLVFADPPASGFQEAPPFAELVQWRTLDNGIRIFLNVSAHQSAAKDRLLVIYATPNGNTLEQTLGCATPPGIDWHYDIQHVAAQIRRYREIDSSHDTVLAVVQAPQLSWPSFRRNHPQANATLRDLVGTLSREVSADGIVMAGHSGGGSFLFGCIEAADRLPDIWERIIFLDANYSYSDALNHGDKLLTWLQGASHRRLVVLAYDDREITLQGKRVVGADGGTFRATHRMLARLRQDLQLEEQQTGSFQHWHTHNKQVELFIHPNPDNKILHTALVGDMNGLLQGLTLGTEQAATWGMFGGPRAYTSWIQPKPFVEPNRTQTVIARDAPPVHLALPPRSSAALTGSQFLEHIRKFSRQERERAIERELLQGNLPDFLRPLTPLRLALPMSSGTTEAICYVMCDYLAVGSDTDFFRMPMSPSTAAAIARATQCELLTTKIADAVFQAADVRLVPQPLTEDRESAQTFFQHHQLIEEQLGDRPRGQLIAGIKKDVVLTNRLRERPHRVALYGWHYPDGRPIQPLYAGHVDWYVDYSHGIRLVWDQLLVDGRWLKLSEVLMDPQLHALLSSEGPLDPRDLRTASGW